MQTVVKTRDSSDYFINYFAHDGARYVTSVPFKPDCEPLPDTFFMHDYVNIFREYEQNAIEMFPWREIAGTLPSAQTSYS